MTKESQVSEDSDSISVLLSTKLRISSYLKVVAWHLRGTVGNKNFKGGIYVLEYMDHNLTGLAGN